MKPTPLNLFSIISKVMFVLVFIVMFFPHPYLNAGTVTKISGDKIILVFKNEPTPQLNSTVVILDQESHKEIGSAQITKVKDSRAIGLLKKGTAKPGDTADILSSELKDHREPAKEEAKGILESNKKDKKRSARISFGAGAEFINTQVLLKEGSNSGSLSGNGFGLKGALEYPVTPKWFLLASSGLHPMVMTSDAANISSVNTNYLSLEGIMRYTFDKRTEGIWIGGGAGYLLAMSSNIKPKPSNEFVLMGSAGYNIKISNTYFSLKGDFIWFSSKKTGNITYQPYQFTVGGIYFF